MQIADLRNALNGATMEAQHYLERFAAELEFAQGLGELEKKTNAWRGQLDAAAAPVVRAATGGNAAAIRSAVLDAERRLASIGKIARTYTVYNVGHAHIDMNWMWGWPETVAATNDTFATVLRLMDEYPDFHFTQSQASVYAIMEKHNPRMLDAIRARVREGRWEVAASHWVEGEKNSVSGESLCRHLLHTRRYLRRLFDLKPEDVLIDWAPDTFGHAVTVPSYLVRGGVRRLYMCRSGNVPGGRPAAFRWRAPDGSTVIVHRETTWYNTTISTDLVPCFLRFFKDTGMKSWMNVYGVGDHGGGPTRRDVERLVDMATWPIFPAMHMATSDAFFRNLETNARRLPLVEEELNFEFTGCYTSQSLIKKSVRFGENQLKDAETLAVLAAAVAGEPYPSANLEEGWRNTLFSHFHDILPGSGVHDTRTFAHGLYQQTAALAGMAETLALRALAARIDTTLAGKRPPGKNVAASWTRSGLGAGVGFQAGQGSMNAAEQGQGHGLRPFIVTNPVGAERRGIATVTVWDNPPERGMSGPDFGRHNRMANHRFLVHTPSGKTIEAQRVDQGAYWSHDYVTLAFPIDPLPGFGWAAYVLEEIDSSGDKRYGQTNTCFAVPEMNPASKPRELAGFRDDRIVMENAHTRVVLDTNRGLLESLVEKGSGAELLRPDAPAGLLELGLERPHGMDAWAQDRFSKIEQPVVRSFTLAKNGPFVARADAALRIGESELTMRYELRADDPNLYITIEGLFVERGSREKGVPALRISFPFTMDKAKARYEIPFGAISRAPNPVHDVPAIRWAEVSGNCRGKRAGCLLINDSKNGHVFDGRTLRMTLIRASSDPDPLPEVGRHEIRLALSPFAGTLPAAGAIARGTILNQPLRTIGTDVHPGPLAATGTFLQVSPGNIVVEAIKKAEDNDSMVLRLYETAGRRTVARIRWPKKVLGEFKHAVETDVLERPISGSSLKRSGDSVTVRVPAFGIATVAVELKRPRHGNVG